AAMESPRDDFAVQCRRPAEDDARAGSKLLARVHQRFPYAVRQARNQQALNGAAAWHAMAKQPRWKHTRVVDDEQIASGEQTRKRRHRRVADGAGIALQQQQARARSIGDWLLRNQVRGEFEIERADVHPPLILSFSRMRYF